MKISVIIPVYNAGRYLEQCLDSVSAQSFGDWECLIVDDGSTDGSGEVCDRYAAADKRFRVFHTPNGGVSAARNVGLEHARAPLAAFVDSDDWIEEGYLSELYRAMEESGAEMSLCGMKKVRSGAVEVLSPEPGTVTVDSNGADGFVALNRLHLLYGPMVKLYRTSIIRTGDIRFPAGIHFGEDLIFNFDYLEHTRTIAVSGESLYNYRVATTGSLSTSAQSRDPGINYQQWKMIRSLFERRGIDGSAAAQFLSNRLWGIAYDAFMSREVSPRELRAVFDASFAGDLRTFDGPSILVPGWLRTIILNRHTRLAWLIRRIKR